VAVVSESRYGCGERVLRREETFATKPERSVEKRDRERGVLESRGEPGRSFGKGELGAGSSPWKCRQAFSTSLVSFVMKIMLASILPVHASRRYWNGFG
jgi:hypothetical protein